MYRVEPYKPEEYEGEFNILYDERNIIKKALTKTSGDQKKAAILLGVEHRVLGYKLELHRLNHIPDNCKSKNKTIKTKYGDRERRTKTSM